MGISPNDAERLIQAFGPIMKLHPQEIYLMDDPDAFLNSGLAAMSRALVYNEDDYDTLSIQWQSNFPIPSLAAFPALWQDARDNDPNKSTPPYRYWITVNDVQKPGNQSRAKAQVKVNQTDAHIDLEFWFFYPFNGPGKFRVTVGNVFTDYVQMQTCGRHYSDWEHVTVRLTPAPGTPQGWSVQSVYLSRHSFSVWISDLTKLQFSGTHPVIYVARDSHAHYPAANDHLYYLRPLSVNIAVGTVAVDLYDTTADGGITFDTSQANNHRLIILNNDTTISKPLWYDFDRRWGQYEKLSYPYQIPVAGVTLKTYTEVGSGPVGPSKHTTDDFSFASILFVPYHNMEVIVANSGNGLNHNWLDPTWNWSDWHAYDGAPAKTFSCVASAPANGNVELFVVAQDDGTLYHSWLAGDNWAPFEANFNSAQKMKHVAVVGYQGQTEVLAVGTDGTLYHTWYAAASGWGKWDVNFQGAPKLARVFLQEAAGNVEGWAIAPDGTVYHNYQLPNWTWASWEGNFNGAPKVSDLAIVGYQGQVEVLAIGTDGRLYHTYYGGSWGAWEKDFKGAPASLKSARLAVARGNVEAWLVAQDGTVYHNYLLPNWTWSSWEANPFGAPKLSTIAVGEWQGQVEVMGIGLDGNPVHNWYDGSWHKWETPFTTGTL